MGGTHEALEHAEHVQHEAHNPFDKKVAMTMAVVAACLASVALISHREHTATLAAKGEAGIKQSEAAVTKNEASDQWSFYQAKNIRKYEFESFLALSKSVPSDPGKEEELKKQQNFWAKQIGKYEKELPEMAKKARELDGEVKKLREEAQHFIEESEHHHHRTNFFDSGHLFIDLALVLCSIAVLTKMRAFWFSGIAICVVGVAVAVVAFTPLASSLTGHNSDGSPGGHGPPGTAPETPGKSHKSESAH
jgi:hypothetical protein